MKFSIDPWAPEYGAPTTSNDALVPNPQQVDVTVETPAEDWRPIPAAALDPAAGPLEVLFVDGIRRIDARVWVTDDTGATRMGLCASFAAGTVRCNGQATVEEVEVGRGLFACGAGLAPVETRTVRYPVQRVTSEDGDQLVNGVQDAMRELEIQVVTRSGDADLVVVDGPLRGRQDVPNAIGYVKSHRVEYLPDIVADTLRALGPGERTPLFTMQTSWRRWSWYLRLPHGGDHPWGGIVRCEASIANDLAAARALADLSASALPRFASRPHKDPRAPQNLYPIAGLERALRRRLGDQQLLFRHLSAASRLTA